MRKRRWSFYFGVAVGSVVTTLICNKLRAVDRSVIFKITGDFLKARNLTNEFIIYLREEITRINY